jgi:hypothetical protein
MRDSRERTNRKTSEKHIFIYILFIFVFLHIIATPQCTFLIAVAQGKVPKCAIQPRVNPVIYCAASRRANNKATPHLRFMIDIECPLS